MADEQPPKSSAITESPLAVGIGLSTHALESSQINKFHVRHGHGFAAEDANALADRLKGLHVSPVGQANTLNGPDRISSGVAIQSKYCPSARATLESAFGSDGIYRYSGQVLEVPPEQHAQCVEMMRERIAAAQVPGVSNASQAAALVKEGSVTYKQAVNIARAGTIEGLVYDIKSQAVTCASVSALSFAVSFAYAKWSGQDTGHALGQAAKAAVATAAITAAAGVASAQILRTQPAAWARVGTRKVIGAVHGTRVGKSLLPRFAQLSLGRAAGSAAVTNHVAKLVRTNALVSSTTVVVATTPDLYRALVEKSVSWPQLAKNMAVRSASVVGGAWGWVLGGLAGAVMGSIIPVAGTVIGAFLGGVAGSMGASAWASQKSKRALDRWRPDDAQQVLALVPPVLATLSFEHLLLESEVAHLGAAVEAGFTPDLVRRVYASSNREEVLRNAFEPVCQAIVSSRPRVLLEQISCEPPSN